MTQDDFRRLALSMPDTIEASHMRHPDFRVGGKIFATLGWPNDSFGMVKLTPEQQQTYVKTASDIFAPVSGAWGRRGSTNVRLAAADAATLTPVMEAAWRTAASKKK